MFSVFGTEKLVVENVERFEPQFDAKPFLEPDPLDDRGVDVPVTRSINRRQAQVTTVARMRKEVRIRATIRTDQRRIDN